MKSARARRTRLYYEDEYGLELPKFDVFLEDFAEAYDQETGLLDHLGQPILKRIVPPKRQAAGFIWFSDDEEPEDEEDYDDE